MEFREMVEDLFDTKGCVSRMNIYVKGDTETVYVEFNPIEKSDKNSKLVSELQRGELAVGPFVMRPQLLL